MLARVSLVVPASATISQSPPSVPLRPPWRVTWDGIKVKPSAGVKLKVAVFSSHAVAARDAEPAFLKLVRFVPLPVLPIHVLVPLSVRPLPISVSAERPNLLI